MKRFYLLPIIFLIAFSSCNKDNGTAPEGKTQSEDKTQSEEATPGMIPLKKGYKWTSSFASYDSLARIVFSGQTIDVIARDTLIENEKWYIEDDGSIGTNRNGEFYGYSHSIKKEYLIFGTSIDDTTKPSKYFDGKYLIAKDVKVKCPLGEFSCYLYQIYWAYPGGRVVTEKYYIAPDKGIIRYEGYTFVRGKYWLDNTRELISTNVF